MLDLTKGVKGVETYVCLNIEDESGKTYRNSFCELINGFIQMELENKEKFIIDYRI